MSSRSAASHPAASRSAVCRALCHYDRALAALRGEGYRDLPPSLRTELLERLGRERIALLRKIVRQGPSAHRSVTARDGAPPRARHGAD
ncbi:MAG: hypothetical protein GVY35_18135 [Bacteroidetes bacterium]|nr:hypothetical protein [Bacteroidota bacterium]